ncbi:MAG: hypothetical protein JKY54_11895 [Flavobacteriales bacterium]|nr:hypothetical protein [Flavobacteriales bacterium]
MRITIGGIVGVVVTFIIIGVIEALSHVIYPPDPSVNWRDPIQFAANIDLVEIPAMIMVAFAHFVGIIGGNIVAKLITKGSKIPGYIIGGLILTGTIINLIWIPHPTWFAVTDVIAVLIAFWLGMKIAKKRQKA